jgi:hypothetical protein
MAERSEEINKRVGDLEKDTLWLKERVWYGTGNLHDRVHNLEDRSADRSFEMEKIKGDVARLERVIGLNEYGEKNLISDLSAALDTINKLKENVITVKDFQSLLNDVKTLKERGQAQLSFMNFIQFGVISAVIGFIMQMIMARVFTP